MIKWLRNLSSQRKQEIADKLHRGFVDVCVGVTLVTGSMMCYKVYEYLRYIRPVQKALRQRAETEMLSIGQAMEINEKEELND